MCDVLHHVPSQDRRGLVATAWECVAPGGHLAVKDWVSTRNLATALAYISDRYLSNDRPDFFPTLEGFTELILAGQGSLTQEGWVRPQRNNRYVVARKLS